MKLDGYIKTLDGWRAVAIILVTFSHLKDNLFHPSSLIYKFADWGLNGVDLFFALSGFLIATKLAQQLDRNGYISLRQFYLKRIFRLMPASWAYLATISILSSLHWLHLHWLEVLSTLTFWRNYLAYLLPHEQLRYTGQFWSLSVEEIFYMFLPSFLLWQKKTNRIIISSTSLILMIALWRKIQPLLYHYNTFFQFRMWDTFGRFDALLFGVLLAYIIRYKATWTKFLSQIHPLIPIILLFITAIFPIPLKPSIEALLFPLLIFSTISHSTTLLAKLLELSVMKYLGKISYSYYIWQQLFLFKMATAPWWFSQLTGQWFSPLIAIVIASISFYVIEDPIRKWGYAKFILRKK